LTGCTLLFPKRPLEIGVDPMARHPLLMAALVPMFGEIMAMLICRVGLDSQTAREVRAGYTTLRREYRDLDMVDPRTGLVRRQAGEPFLPAEEHAVRRSALRNHTVDR